MSAHKCPNCKATGHRAGYCTPCAAIYRKVLKWVASRRQSTESPVGVLFWVIDPDPDVEAWLTKRGKMPDMENERTLSAIATIRSVLSA